MSTTTIRLTEELKARIARAAEQSGTTAHNFILEAIAEKADQAERQRDFLETAETRFAALAATGKTIAWEEMQRHLKAKSAGKKTSRPVARKFIG